MPNPKRNSVSTVLFVRGAPRSLALKLKAAAALQGYRSVNAYLIDHLQAHVEELERKGVLPKSKS
jgi:hypothetical protein